MRPAGAGRTAAHDEAAGRSYAPATPTPPAPASWPSPARGALRSSRWIRPFPTADARLAAGLTGPERARPGALLVALLCGG
ncbi:hypothetical protein [Streptomyces sp. NRRL F-5123]|uniref:hypothetical protein n=1 Tax=Streptomyces sp. NRRL F-5123 TaxID=1463856 RepID=UPI000AEB6B59|nr:hypothetical protein [Streptomyces sp. NRRL F-5123]